MTRKLYNIKIDVREQDRGIQAYKFFESNFNSNISVEQLNVGDYVFEDKVVWEYKTIDDFCSSFENGSVLMENM